MQSLWADVWQSRILLLNNQPEPLHLSPPVKSQYVTASYPTVIQPFQKGEVVVEINKSWMAQALASIVYTQPILLNQGMVTLSITRRHPDFELKKVYEPGFDCDFQMLGVEAIKVERLFKTDTYCDIISFSQ